MTQTEALRLALEALEMFCEHGAILRPIEIRNAIKAALEAKDEPVALKPCAYESKEKKMCRKCGQVHAEAIWDTTPPQRTWVGLTDEDLPALAGDNGKVMELQQVRRFAKVIETKLKEKNT